MATPPKIRQELVARDRSQTVAITSVLLLETNLNRVWVAFVNKGANDVHLRLGEAAVNDEGIYLKALSGTLLLDMILTPWYGEVYAIAITTPSRVTVQEVERRV